MDSRWSVRVVLKSLFKFSFIVACRFVVGRLTVQQGIKKA